MELGVYGCRWTGLSSELEVMLTTTCNDRAEGLRFSIGFWNDITVSRAHVSDEMC